MKQRALDLLATLLLYVVAAAIGFSIGAVLCTLLFGCAQAHIAATEGRQLGSDPSGEGSSPSAATDALGQGGGPGFDPGDLGSSPSGATKKPYNVAPGSPAYWDSGYPIEVQER